MRRLYIELDDDVFDALVERSVKTRRDVRDQAAVELRRLKHVRGALELLVDRDPPLDRENGLCAYCQSSYSRTADLHSEDCPWGAARFIYEEPIHADVD